VHGAAQTEKRLGASATNRPGKHSASPSRSERAPTFSKRKRLFKRSGANSRRVETTACDAQLRRHSLLNFRESADGVGTASWREVIGHPRVHPRTAFSSCRAFVAPPPAMVIAPLASDGHRSGLPRCSPRRPSGRRAERIRASLPRHWLVNLSRSWSAHASAVAAASACSHIHSLWSSHRRRISSASSQVSIKWFIDPWSAPARPVDPRACWRGLHSGLAAVGSRC